MIGVSLRAGVIAVLGFAALSSCGAPEVPTACDTNLKDVTQLIVVVTDTLHTAESDIAVFRRANDSRVSAWKLHYGPFKGVVGSAGLGWGVGFEALQRSGEPVKQEGDKRSPAGVYQLGRSFGFDAQPWPGHLNLKENPQVCVDDLQSPHYGAIVSRQVAGADTSAEDMAEIPVYKRGIVVGYPGDRRKKSGSCIFFHIWQGAGAGTAGCIASPEADIAVLQSASRRVKTAAVIWARSTSDRLQSCIPNLPLQDVAGQKNRR